MEQYLFKCTIELSWEAKIKNISSDPVFIVATDKEKARNITNSKLKYGCKVKNTYLCGRQISHNMFRGKK